MGSILYSNSPNICIRTKRDGLVHPQFYDVTFDHMDTQTRPQHTHLEGPPAETGSLGRTAFAALPVPPVCSAHKLSPHPASARPVLCTWQAQLAGQSLGMKNNLLGIVFMLLALHLNNILFLQPTAIRKNRQFLISCFYFIS